MKKPKGMRWEYCSLCCKFMVICSCGNNCCNGCSGQSIHGNGCDCEEAYEYQMWAWKNTWLKYINRFTFYFFCEFPVKTRNKIIRFFRKFKRGEKNE